MTSSLNNTCVFTLVNVPSRKIRLFKILSPFSVGPIEVHNDSLGKCFLFCSMLTWWLSLSPPRISPLPVMSSCLLTYFSFPYRAGLLHTTTWEMKGFQLNISNPQSWLPWSSLAHLSVNKSGTFERFWNHDRCGSEMMVTEKKIEAWGLERISPLDSK